MLNPTTTYRVALDRLLPFLAMHLGCLAVFWVGFSWTSFLIAYVYYAVRAFGLTAFYHRYFSHRAFKTSRVGQFLGAALGCAALQRGPLWWSAHHREHHRRSDHAGDVHSPHEHGFWWSHTLWFLSNDNNRPQHRFVRDWRKFPELVWLDYFDLVIPIVGGILMYVAGDWLRVHAPQLGVTGWQLFVWGFLISTVFLYHVTYSVNSIAHLIGSRRFETKDDSRNNWVIALLALGEGWHNNHHRYPLAARQGFYWWEVDITYYGLLVLSWLGLVWDLKPVPQHILDSGLVAKAVDKKDSKIASAV